MIKGGRFLKSAVFGVVLVAVVLGAAACGEEEPATTTAPPTTAPPTTAPVTEPVGEMKTLTIGTIMPLTGPLAVVGIAFNRAWDIYAEDVNNAGGVKIGEDTYTIRFIHEDSKGSAEGASTAAAKLVHEDNVNMVLGGMLEVEVAAINDVTQAAGVLFAQANVNIPGAPQDIGPEKPLQVRPFINHDDNQAINLDFILETYPEAKTIGLSAPDLGYDEMIERLVAQATARGMEVVAQEIWTWGTTDFIPVMTRLNAANPDIIWAMVSAQAPHQLTAARQLGFEGVFVSNAPLGADVFQVIVEDPVFLTDVLVNSINVHEPPNPEIGKLMDDWKAKWPGDPFVSSAVHGYDMPWVMVQIMQKAGTIDAATVVATMEGMTTPGDLQTLHGPGYIGGMERFGVNRALYRPLPLSTIMNGEIQFVGFKAVEEK